MSPVQDSAQRRRAIDPLGSFCVSAPAGSGKTELLIQRYLGLLSRVSRPEQVLAITFTRKAAAGMRERVLQALRAARDGLPCESDHQRITRELAEAALAADEAYDWRLLRDIARFNIKTIDSFCAGLTRQMPVLSLFGGMARPRDDARPLYEEAVTELFALVDTSHAIAPDLRRLLAHFDNDWPGLQQLFVDMLGRRDQWQKYIGVHEAPEESEAYLVRAVEDLVLEELRTLAGLLLPYREEILELQRFAARNLGREELWEFPGDDPAQLDDWRLVRELLMTAQGQWRKPRGINVKCGFPADKTGEPKQRKEQVAQLLAELETVPALESRLAGVAILPQVSPGSEAWQLALSLSRLLPVLAAELALVFSRHGAVDYSQLSQSALHALGEDDAPTELALRLDYRIEHILVDEFQDTSINQYELLRKLTRGWGEHNAANPGAPRTLLVVGDAQQSIYGFRDANVGLFQRVWRTGFNGVVPEHLVLQCNFRSDGNVVEWVNQTFATHFPGEDDIDMACVGYRPAAAVHAAGVDAGVTVDAFRGEDSTAAEVEFVSAAIARCVAAGERSIGVLARQRSHLRPIGRRLKELGVPCHASELDSLANSPVAADLLTLCRALANDADRLAWLALLRAPWCGLCMADLLAVARFGPDSPGQPLRVVLRLPGLERALSPDGQRRLAHLRGVVERAWAGRDRLSLRVWVEQAWLDLGGPACARDELALADAESFLQLLEQAEDEALGLDVDWLERQLLERAMSGGSPDCPVHLMTLHKAKGLEFHRVFIPRLDGRPRGDSGDLLRWDEQTREDGEAVFLLAANDGSEAGEPTLYRYLGERRKVKQAYESTRLLYVGATRAIRHLHLSAGIGWDEKKDEPGKPPATSLLHTIWDTFARQMRVSDAVALATPVEAGNRPLVRLRAADLPPSRVMEPARMPADNFPERPDNHFERVVGTVVHLALEELSLGEVLPDAVADRDRDRWRCALQVEGLAGEALDRGLALVLASMDASLREGGEGRWVLSKSHRDARSEWAMTCIDEEGEVRDIVIDRTFVDADTGVRWIIDYKTSSPLAGEAQGDFLSRQGDTYAGQLRRYRDALRRICEEPLRCALFFTRQGLLHPIPELDLPA